jgi:uncharacterized membrane protein
MVNNNKLSRNLTLISLILAGEAIFFLPFVLPRIFRPTLLAVFEINNTELGSFFSVYGVVAMVSYFLVVRWQTDFQPGTLWSLP